MTCVHDFCNFLLPGKGLIFLHLCVDMYIVKDLGPSLVFLYGFF